MVTGLDHEDRQMAGRDMHSGTYDPFILNKSATGFRFYLDDSHSATGYKFCWNAVYQGDSGNQIEIGRASCRERVLRLV